jgi:hypothetical protein
MATIAPVVPYRLCVKLSALVLTARQPLIGSAIPRRAVLTNPYKSLPVSRHLQVPVHKTGAIRSFSTGANVISLYETTFKSNDQKTWTFKFGCCVLGAGATVAIAFNISDPLYASTSPATDVADKKDVLSKLDPVTLMHTTQHLKSLPFVDLLRLYCVYLASSSSTLVSAGPSILSKLEWTRDNIPILGGVIWEAFAFVSSVVF